MAYEGWRIQINNNIFPNVYMERGSYSCAEEKRVIRTWTDANNVEHQDVAETKKTRIRFRIKQHDLTEHATICNLLENEDEITVNYYSEKTNTYKTGTFRMENIEFYHLNATHENIYFDSTEVVLYEY